MSDKPALKFNPPPGWPQPPKGWIPPLGWTPDPAWPPLPEGWSLWVSDTPVAADVSSKDTPPIIEPSSMSGRAEDAEVVRGVTRLAELEEENEYLRAQLDSLRAGGSRPDMDDDRVLQDVGIYRYHHPLEDAVAYQGRLEDLFRKIAQLVSTGGAIQVSERFTFDGSLAKGRRMTSDLAQLMLRAYNAEAENVVRTVRPGAVVTAKKRLEATRGAIARLGRMMQMHISDAFHALRLEEIDLTADYQMKKQEERETERAERERLREERKVERELAEAREKLEKEKAHIVAVIEKLKADGRDDAALEQSLAEVNEAIAQNDFRVANVRAGYVYVISNRGAFGGRVVKIGLTRRLAPRDRINELGDASVPFRFDVHAIYFSEDAVTLENTLHSEFESRRLNWANDRKEFFFATPAEVRTVLLKHVGNLLEFVEHGESDEYLQSVKNWPAGTARD